MEAAPDARVPFDRQHGRSELEALRLHGRHDELHALPLPWNAGSVSAFPQVGARILDVDCGQHRNPLQRGFPTGRCDLRTTFRAYRPETLSDYRCPAVLVRDPALGVWERLVGAGSRRVSDAGWSAGSVGDYPGALERTLAGGGAWVDPGIGLPVGHSGRLTR